MGRWRRRRRRWRGAIDDGSRNAPIAPLTQLCCAEPRAHEKAAATHRVVSDLRTRVGRSERAGIKSTTCDPTLVRRGAATAVSAKGWRRRRRRRRRWRGRWARRWPSGWPMWAWVPRWRWRWRERGHGACELKGVLKAMKKELEPLALDALGRRRTPSTHHPTWNAFGRTVVQGGSEK